MKSLSRKSKKKSRVDDNNKLDCNRTTKSSNSIFRRRNTISNKAKLYSSFDTKNKIAIDTSNYGNANTNFCTNEPDVFKFSNEELNELSAIEPLDHLSLSSSIESDEGLGLGPWPGLPGPENWPQKLTAHQQDSFQSTLASGESELTKITRNLSRKFSNNKFTKRMSSLKKRQERKEMVRV